MTKLLAKNKNHLNFAAPYQPGLAGTFVRFQQKKGEFITVKATADADTLNTYIDTKQWKRLLQSIDNVRATQIVLDIVTNGLFSNPHVSSFDYTPRLTVKNWKKLADYFNFGTLTANPPLRNAILEQVSDYAWNAKPLVCLCNDWQEQVVLACIRLDLKWG